MTIARHLSITGRVQGVFFRATAKKEAERLGVTGWVRNRDDGSVEAHVEGARVAVDDLVERLREEPAAAKVHGIEVLDVEPEGFDDFAIRS